MLLSRASKGMVFLRSRAREIPAPTADSPRAFSLAALYFACVTALFAWPALFGRSSSMVPGVQAQLWPWQGEAPGPFAAFPQRDGAVSSYPWSVSYDRAISAGEFPFWDWHSFTSGYDVFSDGVSGAAYPIHWLVWFLFDPAVAHDVYMIVHLWLGGLLMYLFLRHLALAGIPAALGGTVWMLAAFNTAWLQAEMITPVLIITPLVFWRVSCVLKKGSTLNTVLAAGSLALALVAGNIVVFLVICWVAGLYALTTVVVCYIASRDRRQLAHQVRTLGIILVASFLLSAYSTIPTLLNLLSLGRRTSTLSEVTGDARPLQRQLSELWLDPSESLMAGHLFTLGWCGKVALLLAIVGALVWTRRGSLGITLAVFFTLLPASPLLIAIGWYAIPPLRAVSGFGRLAFLASFGIALLAALGAASVREFARRSSGRRPVRTRRSWHVTAAGFGIIGLVLVEMVPFMNAANPPWVDRNRVEFFPVTTAQETILSHAEVPGQWPGLMIPISEPTTVATDPEMAWNEASFWGLTSHTSGIDSVSGYDSAVPWRSTVLARAMQGTPLGEAIEPFIGAFLPTFSLTWTRLDLMQRVGVTHIYGSPTTDINESAYAGWATGTTLVHDGPDGRVWEVEGAARGPRVVDQIVVVDNAESALIKFTSAEFDVENSLILEQRDDQNLASTPISDGALSLPGSVRSSERGSNSAAVDVSLDRAGWLVVPIGFSEGWSASVDGAAVETRPANFAFMAVEVPSGDHRVTFSFRPPGFVVGSWLTLVAALIATVLLATNGVRRLRSRRPAGLVAEGGLEAQVSDHQVRESEELDVLASQQQRELLRE